MKDDLELIKVLWYIWNLNGMMELITAWGMEPVEVLSGADKGLEHGNCRGMVWSLLRLRTWNLLKDVLELLTASQEKQCLFGRLQQMASLVHFEQKPVTTKQLCPCKSLVAV